VAEEELDRLLKHEDNKEVVPDGFEGNAQSFRIVTKLAAKYPTHPGLNCSRATLAAILKYPWLFQDPRSAKGKKHKWGAYDSERAELEWATSWLTGKGGVRSIEAALMDWADDIAYAVNDLEDFVRAGLVPLGLVAEDRTERKAFLDGQMKQYWEKSDDEIARLSNALDRIATLAPRRFDGSRVDRAKLKGFTSSLISKYIGSVKLLDNGIGDQSLQIDEDAQDEVTVLKGLTWNYVIRRKSLRTQRFGQRALIRDLFSIFDDASKSPDDHAIFPRSFADDLETITTDRERLRVVADVIASMSETQVVEIHQRLTGRSLGSALDEVMA
jgi:dGTPase